MKIYHNAMVEIENILTHDIKVCHLKEIRKVEIRQEGPSYIEGFPTSKEDAELIRDIMINKLSFKDAINQNI